MRLRTHVQGALVALALVVTGLVVLPVSPAAAVVDDSSPTVGWRPANGTAYAIARVGDMVVLGGSFTQVVSATGTIANRSRMAAISASTGELLPWAPNPNGTVRAIAGSPNGATVYFGGTFTSVGSTAKTNLAAVSASSGALTSFNAVPNGEVRALMYYDGGLFAGGTFWRIGSANRGGGAELDPVSGAVRAWNPNTNWGTYALAPAPDGSAIFVGGPFSMAGGESRDFLAKVSRTTGALQPWLSGSTCQDVSNPCQILSLATEGNTLYVGSGGPGGRVTSLDVTTGVQRWWSGGDGDVQAIGLQGNTIFAGGHFEATFNGVARAGLVALDKYTGAVLSKPSALVLGGTAVWTLLVDGSTLRFGGQFVTVGSTQAARYSTFPILPDPADTQPPARPGTPSSPAVFADSISLRWTASTDNVATVEYRILRDGSQVGVSTVPFYRDIAVGPNTAYTYSVVAVDASGNLSEASPTVRLTTPSASATLLPRSASWRYWSRGTDPGATWIGDPFDDSGWGNGVGEFGFGDGDEHTFISPLGVVHYFRTPFTVDDVSRVTSATLRLLVDDGAVVYVNGTEVGRFNMPTGVVTNTTTASTSLGGTDEMTYRTIAIPVSALRSGTNRLAISVHNFSTGSSDVSLDAFVTAQLQANPAVPATPIGLAGSTTANSASLTWGSVNGATSYDVFRAGIKVGSSSSPSYSDSGLQPSTPYTYTVAAVTSAGSSLPSNPVTLTTTVNPPAAPAGLRVTGTTATSVSLAWDPVAGAADYVVSRGGTPLPAVSGTSLTDSGRTPATSYSYTVVARNGAGAGQASSAVAATTDPDLTQAPAAPSGLRVTGTDDASVSLAWDAVPGATDYVVSRDGSELPAVTGRSLTDTGRAATTSYTYTVIARNGAGAGPASAAVTATTTATPQPPDAPSSLRVTGTSSTTVSLAWDAAAGATDYVVTRNGTALAPVTGTSLIDTGRTPGTSYTYSVVARNAVGSGAQSSSVTATTSSAPVTAYSVTGDLWRANDTGADLGTTWRAVGYDDSSWKSGPSQLGYGDGDEATTLTWGTDPNRKPLTDYFRRTFDAGSITDVTSLSLRALIDDAAVVYLNGSEIWRFNLPTGTITAATGASRAISGAEENQWRTVAIPRTALVAGTNTLAVEVHNDVRSSSDVTFDLELRPVR